MADSQTTANGHWKIGVMTLMLGVEGVLILMAQQQIAFGAAVGALVVYLAWIGSESYGR